MLSLINKNHYKRFFTIFLMMLLIGIFDVLSIGAIIPLLTLINESPNNTDGINFFVNNLIGEYSYEKKLYYISIFILIFFSVKNILTIINTRIISNYLLFFTAELQQRLFEKFVKMKFSELIKIKSEKYIRDIAIETRLVINSYLSPIFDIIINILTILFFSILLFIYSFKVTIIILVIISIISFFVIFVFKQTIDNFGKIRQDATGKIIGHIKQTYDGIRELKLDNSENFFLQEFKKNIEKLAITGVNRSIIGISPRIIFELTLVTFFVFFILVSLNFSSNLDEAILQLTIFGASSLRMIPSITSAIRGYQKINYAKSALKVIKNFLIKEHNQTEKSNTDKKIENLHFQSKISIKNISFSYSKKKILDNLSFDIHKNKFYILKGDNGSGKSTLVDIICGLQKPDEGQILIDKHELNLQYNKFNKISYIQQEPYIFNLSLAKNIAIQSNINQKDYVKIEKLVSMVGLKSFVDNLDNGVDTLLFDKGVNISGGQKQKISIARALYQDKEIIILDETFSNLDKDSKFEIMTILNSFKNHKTIIMISHDEDILQYADKILLLKNKKIYYET
jgi:ATP-binding cassette, subfamily B, bacterial PglK